MAPRMTWEMRYRAFVPVFFAVLGTFAAVRAWDGVDRLWPYVIYVPAAYFFGALFQRRTAYDGGTDGR